MRNRRSQCRARSEPPCQWQELLHLTSHAEVPKLEGDFSLNAANTLSASLLLEKGLQRLAPTHDLNAAQLAALGRSLGPHRCAQAFSVLIAAHVLTWHNIAADGASNTYSLPLFSPLRKG